MLPASVDPDLFTIRARLKHAEDLPAIRAEILETVKRFQDELIAADKLEAVKKRERYGFTMRLDNSESVAQTVAEYVALRRTPDTIDKLYAQYGAADAGRPARDGAQVSDRERPDDRDVNGAATGAAK